MYASCGRALYILYSVREPGGLGLIAYHANAPLAVAAPLQPIN